jgi:diguanylate cyclase (GGDEF)-like protein/PAS domain S-box-containing protein
MHAPGRSSSALLASGAPAPADAPPGPAADAEAVVRDQKTELLYRNFRLTAVATFINAPFLAFVVTSLNVPAGAAYGWLAAVVGLMAGRVALARAYARAAPAARSAPAWRRRYLAGSALGALAWSSCTAVAWFGDDTALLFTSLALSGTVAVALPILTPAPAAFRNFALLIMLPLAVAVLWREPAPLNYSFGALCLLFLGSLLVSAHRLHESLDASIRLGLEQAELARRLVAARDAAEAALAERGRAQDTYRANEERYRLILQHSPAGILQYDSDLVITYCNERWASIIQVPRDRLIGLDMKHLKDQRFLNAMRAALAGRPGRYEGEYRATQSHAQIWVSMACTPFHDAQGVATGGIAIIEDVSERRRSEDEIRNLAYFDPLTHLPNRRLLLDRLGHAMTASNRNREFGALMILDLDHFKSINDTQGHDVGDRLLVEVARRLVACLREVDTVSRLGGDEYVVLLEGLGTLERSAAALAESFAERMRQSVQAPYVLGGSEAEYFSTTSIGLTLFRGQESAAEVLLKQADVALYQAKNAGRNAARFFSPAMQASIDTRAALESALRRGLDGGEFLLHFQPQIERDGRLSGAEALIRWQPPGQALVPPAQFIPLAEESALILALGQWVLERACTQLKAWSRDPALRPLHLSVNVSARQFHQPDFVDQVRQSLLSSGIDAARLKLELTENVVLDHVESVIERMREITALGVGFALDDFGTGYSSLSYLKRLPLDQVKIDQTFVRDVPGDPNDVAIVRAILAMSQSLGLKVLAEGVETEEQRRFLARNGCAAYQGFLFSRPLAIDAFEQLARDWPHESLRAAWDSADRPEVAAEPDSTGRP